MSNEELQRLLDGFAARIAAQSEVLTRCAENTRRLGVAEALLKRTLGGLRHENVILSCLEDDIARFFGEQL